MVKKLYHEDIINEIDRLFPLATTDIDVLSAGGYTQEMQDELAGLRDLLRDESASKRKLNGGKKGARAGEMEALKEGRFVLRQGIGMACLAIARRQVPQGESPQVTREVATEMTNRVQALSGYLGIDSAVLRTRLETLKSLLAEPDFAPSKAAKKFRDEFIARLDAAAARLGSIAESKKSLQDGSKDKTVSMDEIKGRAYSHIRLLTRIGMAAFRAAGGTAHADLYKLTDLTGKYRPKVPQTNAPPSGQAGQAVQPAKPVLTPAAQITPPAQQEPPSS